ncbi:MAG: bile acid:sodium symporter family protein, partial [Bacteroidaceae bacterium]|nr:bile acid:sodium symporter family protein [Bacteroidaceae bacterium]
MSKLLSRYLALIVLSVAALALLLPSLFKWIPTSSVSLLLGIVMFGMGLTLKPQDFKVVFTKPQAVVIAFIA